MATREEIKDSINTVFATGVSGGILAQTVRVFMQTFLASVLLKKTININGTTYQDDDFIDAQDVLLLSNGLIDSGYTFDSVTGTITFAFPVVENNVIALY